MPEKFGFQERVLDEASELWPIEYFLQKRAEWFIEKSGIEKYLKVGGQYLDVGTGRGHITQRVLADMETSGAPLKGYYGIDIAERPLRKVQKREATRLKKTTEADQGKNPMGFVWADGEDLPFQDGTLDGVSYIFSIHHMDKVMTGKVMQEAKRVCKPDGNIFVAEDIVDSDEQRKLTEDRDRLLNWEGKDAKHNYKSDQEWEEYFNGLGLEVVGRELFNSETRKGPIPHGFYVLRKKPEVR